MGKIDGSQKARTLDGKSRQGLDVRRVQERRDSYLDPNGCGEPFEDGEGKKAQSKQFFGKDWTWRDIDRNKNRDNGGVVSQFEEACLDQLADNDQEIALHLDAIARLKLRNEKLKQQLSRAREIIETLQDEV